MSTVTSQACTNCNKNLCTDNIAPPSSVVRSCLGSTLAQVFFDYSHHDTIKLLDVLPPSKTSRACFPVPSDNRLKEDKLVPPTDNQIVKAFVHQNILEIGEDILENVKVQIEKDLREKVERQSREKFYIYQAKKRWEIEQQSQRVQEHCEEYIETVRRELQKQLEEEWSKAAIECAKNTQKAVAAERMTVVQDMMRKMRAEMTYVIRSLYKEFEDSFHAQRDNIIADFNQIIREKHVKMMNEMHEYQQKVNADLNIQKRQFEMQNTADVMYVLCLERMRCNREKHIMHTYFEEQIVGFQKLLVCLDDVIKVMRIEILYCHAEKKVLEEELCDVSKQFQKFIDFVFRAVPGQAEYLLPFQLQGLTSTANKKLDETDKGKQ